MAGAEANTVEVFSSEQLWLTDEEPGLERHTVPFFLLSFFLYVGVGVTNLYLKSSACARAFAVTNNKVLLMWRLLDNGLVGGRQFAKAKFPELLLDWLHTASTHSVLNGSEDLWDAHVISFQ